MIKKFITDLSIHNSKYAFWIKKFLIETNFLDPQSVIETRLPDSAI